MRERVAYGAARIGMRRRQLYGAKTSVWKPADDVGKRTPNIHPDFEMA